MTVQDMLGRTGVITREDALKLLEAHFTASRPVSGRNSYQPFPWQGTRRGYSLARRPS